MTVTMTSINMVLSIVIVIFCGWQPFVGDGSLFEYSNNMLFELSTGSDMMRISICLLSVLVTVLDDQILAVPPFYCWWFLNEADHLRLTLWPPETGLSAPHLWKPSNSRRRLNWYRQSIVQLGSTGPNDLTKEHRRLADSQHDQNSLSYGDLSSLWRHGRAHQLHIGRAIAELWIAGRCLAKMLRSSPSTLFLTFTLRLAYARWLPNMNGNGGNRVIKWAALLRELSTGCVHRWFMNARCVVPWLFAFRLQLGLLQRRDRVGLEYGLTSFHDLLRSQQRVFQKWSVFTPCMFFFRAIPICLTHFSVFK